MDRRSLYFDESGFTGYNLLDNRQPIFAIASTDLNSMIAEDILNESFPNYQGEEFKFSKLWRSNKYKNQFPKFGKKIGEYSDRIYIWHVDKKFAVLTKIVDYLVEPMAREAGYDFYADGFSLNYTNYIHFGLTRFVSEQLHISLLQAYQAFSRNPTLGSLRTLQMDLSNLARQVRRPMNDFFDLIALGAKEFTRYFNLETFRGSDELQLTSMVAIVGYWRNIYPEDFEILHDASSNFFRRIDEWRKITNSNVPKQLHPSASGMLYQFPLRVNSTKSIDSKDSMAIQLCDIIAGFAARNLRKSKNDADLEVMEMTLSAGLGEAMISGIAPEIFDPNRLKPQRREGPDAVDRMTEIIFGKHNETLNSSD